MWDDEKREGSPEERSERLRCVMAEAAPSLAVGREGHRDPAVTRAER
jgi:hypothetical protein